jgi:hypothetical protein
MAHEKQLLSASCTGKELTPRTLSTNSKNQWDWAGFTTLDFECCQVMARFIAVVYNWWSLFAHQ